MAAKLTKPQRAAMEKLADGRRHRLDTFTTNTRMSLLMRGLIDCRGKEGDSYGSSTLDYFITDAGRVALGVGP